MKNVTGKIMNAWYELLNGNISVPVYRTDAPPTEEGNYLLLRAESDSDNSNNHSFVTNPVIITEVITKFSARIDDGLAGEIDDEVGTLVKPTSATHALPVQDDIQIVDVRRSNATYINEDDGTFRYHRLITRNLHRVVQLVNES
jgi:hypothetical protein